MGGILHIATQAPDLPDDADFALVIEFKRGEGNPQRIFQAADAMIRALQKLDHTLCGAIDNKIKPVLMLEDVEKGSLRIWLKNALQASEDEALLTLDWKPLVGRYLVRAKYFYIKWANKSDGERKLIDLAKGIREIAAETEVRQLGDYGPPDIQQLAQSAMEIDAAKSFLNEGDTISYEPPDGPPINFDLTSRWTSDELNVLLIKETVKASQMPVTLIVKRPDYLGNSKWDFRHGQTQISAKIEDKDWLKKFQSRQVDVRPGDALKCLADVSQNYGYDNELVSSTYVIAVVIAVLPNLIQEQQLPL